MTSARIYIAGPVTGSGVQAVNAANAIRVGDELANHGMVPCIPHLFITWEMAYPKEDQEFWMIQCMEWLLTCHALLRLPGESSGADREVEAAKAHGIPVFYQTVDLLVAFRDGVLDVSQDEPFLRRFQREVSDWLDRQPFAVQPPHQALLGIGEEVGELMHAHLKAEQQIRGGTDPDGTRDKKMDALGDMLVYMAGYCRSNDLDLHDSLSRAWTEVKERDWTTYPDTGMPSEAEPPVFDPGTPGTAYTT